MIAVGSWDEYAIISESSRLLNVVCNTNRNVWLKLYREENSINSTVERPSHDIKKKSF